MIRARFILLPIASLALLAAATYAFLPMLLGAWLQHLLIAQGFSQVRLDLGYPGLQTLHVRHLEMTGTAGDRTFDFSAHKIEIKYQLGDLLHGRIHTLRIPQAALRVAPLPSTAATAPQPLAIPVPSEWLRALPFQELVVENLQVDWHTGETETHTILRGRAEHLDTQFLTHWSLADKTQPFLEFKLVMSDDGTLNATLFRPAAPNSPLLRASVAVTPQENQTVAIHGSLDAQLKPLAVLLALWLPKTMLPVDGRLQADWKGKAPAILPVQTAGVARGAAFNGVLNVDFSQLQLGTHLQAGSLHLKASLSTDENSLRWRLEDSARFSARLDPAMFAFGSNVEPKDSIRKAKPTTVNAARGFSGQLEFSAPEWHLILPPQSKILIEQLQTPDAKIATLSVALVETARIIYQPQNGQWKTEGLALTLAAPAIHPQLTAFGDIENFTLTAKLERGLLNRPPALRVEDVGLSLLGGRVSGHRIHYDRTRATNAFTLEIKHLDLARVVALEQQQQIEASGTLDGSLPFILTPQAIRIVDGQLQATPAGGVIRYHANESIQSMAAANPNLKLALQAFSNYHYQKLDVGVNYAENGDLALAVVVAGRNPDWNAGQPINLNINISENIPTLLRSLRFGDDIGNEFQRRVNERPRAAP